MKSFAGSWQTNAGATRNHRVTGGIPSCRQMFFALHPNSATVMLEQPLMLTVLSERTEEIRRFHAKPWPFQRTFKPPPERAKQIRIDLPRALLV